MLIIILSFLFFIILVIIRSITLGSLGIQLPDPSFDTTQMEGMSALLTVPCGTTLVNRILANDALLSTFAERFYKVLTLLCEGRKLI